MLEAAALEESPEVGLYFEEASLVLLLLLDLLLLLLFLLQEIALQVQIHNITKLRQITRSKYSCQN